MDNLTVVADDILDIAINPDPAPVDDRQQGAARLAPTAHGAEPTAAERPAPSTAMLLLRELVETIVLTLVIFGLIRLVIQNYRIEGQSMEPNFHDGQYLLVNKLAYRLGEPTRGDVIVFHYPRDPERDFIKRIVGLPGDTVEVRNGVVLVNGMPIAEPYIANSINYNSGPTVVDPDTLYVLGDNRPNSEDSHRWGLLPQDLVIGKAWVSVWPLLEVGLVTHIEPLTGLPTALGP